MSHVFISYSKKNRVYARQLAAHLLSLGFDIWIDDRIDYGESWERVIFRAIDSCAAFLVIMTPESYDSDWVLRECQYAEKRRKPQFPVLLAGEEFPRYGPTQYADVRDGGLPPAEFYERLAIYAPRQTNAGSDVTEGQVATTTENTPLPAEMPITSDDVMTDAQVEEYDDLLPEASEVVTEDQPDTSEVEDETSEDVIVPGGWGNYYDSHPIVEVSKPAVDPVPDKPIYRQMESPVPVNQQPRLPEVPRHGIEAPAERTWWRQIRVILPALALVAIIIVGTLINNSGNANRSPGEGEQPAREGASSEATELIAAEAEETTPATEVTVEAESTLIVTMAATEEATAEATIEVALAPTAIGGGFGRIVFNSTRPETNLDNEIFVMNVDGSNLTRLTNSPGADVNPVWSPDGERIAFISYRDTKERLYIMDSDGSNVRRLTTGDPDYGYEESASWSPDGLEIAFYGFPQIYIINSDGSNLRQWRNLGGNSFLTQPDWSLDGKQIAFATYLKGNSDIYVGAADGSGSVRPVSQNEANDSSPAWSPDGQWIAFVSDRDGDYEIFIADVNGRNLRQLTFNGTGDYGPVWSPDGQWIVFYSYRDGENNTEIYIMDRKGSNVRRLTDNLGADGSPSWR